MRPHVLTRTLLLKYNIMQAIQSFNNHFQTIIQSFNNMQSLSRKHIIFQIHFLFLCLFSFIIHHIRYQIIAFNSFITASFAYGYRPLTADISMSIHCTSGSTEPL
eukprot:1013512_1